MAKPRAALASRVVTPVHEDFSKDVMSFEKEVDALFVGHLDDLHRIRRRELTRTARWNAVTFRVVFGIRASVVVVECRGPRQEGNARAWNNVVGHVLDIAEFPHAVVAGKRAEIYGAVSQHRHDYLGSSECSQDCGHEEQRLHETKYSLIPLARDAALRRWFRR